MSKELKDCPFCGRTPPQSERADNNTTTGRSYFIACMCGGYSANAHQFGETKEVVVSKWNRRATVASAAPTDELPPFPEGVAATGRMREYTAAYARSAIAASIPRAAASEAMTDAQIEEIGQHIGCFQAKQFRESRGQEMTEPERVDYWQHINFARNIIAAAGQNAALASLPVLEQPK